MLMKHPTFWKVVSEDVDLRVCVDYRTSFFLEAPYRGTEHTTINPHWAYG